MTLARNEGDGDGNRNEKNVAFLIRAEKRGVAARPAFKEIITRFCVGIVKKAQMKVPESIESSKKSGRSAKKRRFHFRAFSVQNFSAAS